MGGYQVDAIVRATTHSVPRGSSQERSVNRHVALDPQMVASVRVRTVSPGAVPTGLKLASTVSIRWYCM
ncbi:hypothetical protein D3C76_1786930 [compost metagenome]